MSIYSLVVVVLRLMALDFLLQVAIQLTPPLLSILRIRDGLIASDEKVEARRDEFETAPSLVGK